MLPPACRLSHMGAAEDGVLAGFIGPRSLDISRESTPQERDSLRRVLGLCDNQKGKYLSGKRPASRGTMNKERILEKVFQIRRAPLPKTGPPSCHLFP